MNIMTKNIFISWLFGLLFVGIGVLNIALVHPVPGIAYLVIALLYFPITNTFLKTKARFAIPLGAKVTVGLVVLWGTLAVSDLAEVLGV